MKRRIVPGGMLALSLAVVLLAATASTASAERGLSPWYCPPPSAPVTGVGTFDQVDLECVDLGVGARSFDFDDRQVGTTSPAQRFALGVWSNDTFNPRISVSGDYAQTNNCPPTLSAGAYPQLQGCEINVTFTPTGTGLKHGTLSTGPGGPTVALTGTGVTTPTPPTLDSPPDLQLSGPKKQELGNAVKVKASCGDEACQADGGGKVTNLKLAGRRFPNGDPVEPYAWKFKGLGIANADLRPGETTTLSLKLKEKTRKLAGKALDKGENVRAKVTVDASDAERNVATAKRTITLVK
jgi:hypothetical protein